MRTKCMFGKCPTNYNVPIKKKIMTIMSISNSEIARKSLTWIFARDGGF